MPIDRILVRGMRLDASIGVDEWEHKTKQLIEVDVEAGVETSPVIDSGELTRGVDFNSIVRIVRGAVSAGHVQLVEVLADNIASAILEQTPALLVTIEVRKFCPCGASANHFGVRMVRTRAGH
jgi:7,8-dihydroneopterin aldolase/epimerase/oxygenase